MVVNSMFLSIFKKNRAREAGEALYRAIVDQARAPRLYTEFSVPDTIEGRFEMVTLHVYLVLRRLKADDRDAAKTSQCLFDAMFQNMDDQLRELGVGDLSVGRKIRKLSENFYGRIEAYEDGLSDSIDSAKLAAALGRNIFADEAEPSAVALSQYVRDLAAVVDAQPIERIARGIVHFDLKEQS